MIFVLFNECRAAIKTDFNVKQQLSDNKTQFGGHSTNFMCQAKQWLWEFFLIELEISTLHLYPERNKFTVQWKKTLTPKNNYFVLEKS